jgi:hypothetical protein
VSNTVWAGYPQRLGAKSCPNGDQTGMNGKPPAFEGDYPRQRGSRKLSSDGTLDTYFNTQKS